MSYPTLPIGAELKEQLALKYHSRRNLMLIGDHGIGKTEFLKSLADDLGIKFIPLNLTIMESYDLNGFPIPDAANDVVRYLPPNRLPKPGAGPGILLADELNRAMKDVQNAILQLATDRRFNDYVFPDDWIIATSMNPDNGQNNVFELDAPLLSRFAKFNVFASASEWAKWGRDNGIHKSIVKYAEADSQVFEGADSNPRAWTYASRDLLAAEKLKWPEHKKRKAIGSYISTEAAAAFFSFLKSPGTPLTAGEVIGNYGRHRKVFQAWGNDNRIDLAKATLRNLQVHLQVPDMYERVVQKSKQNLARFLGDLRRHFPDLFDEAREWFNDYDFKMPRVPRC